MLSASIGCKNVSNLSQIVRLVHTNRKYWPAVEALVQKTNSAGFQAWQEAQKTLHIQTT